jgi:hypothetical protein
VPESCLASTTGFRMQTRPGATLIGPAIILQPPPKLFLEMDSPDLQKEKLSAETVERKE